MVVPVLSVWKMQMDLAFLMKLRTVSMDTTHVLLARLMNQVFAVATGNMDPV